MELQAITKLYYSLGLIKEQLELLEFWQKYPEIASIQVSYIVRYDHQDWYMRDIKFVSLDARRDLILRYFPNHNMQEEVAMSEWMRVLPFVALNIMDDEDEVYTRSDEEELKEEVKILKRRAQALVLDCLKQGSVNVIVQ